MHDLNDCRDLVWRYRERLADVWPTPNTLDSLRFAVTEAAEALDAHLRTNDAYARNHDKDLSVHAELADCAMMLLTALGNVHTMNPQATADYFSGLGEWDTMRMNSVDYIAIGCSEALNEYLFAPTGTWHHYATRTLVLIQLYERMNLYAELQARLRRIEAKHAPQPIALDDEQRRVQANLP